MPFLPIGEWLPDQPDFNNPGAAIIKNVVPRTQQSYGPMPTPQAYSGALTTRCQGAYAVQDRSGNVYVFAGDTSKLYVLKSGSTAFTDVSVAGGYACPSVLSGGFWSMTAFGTRVIATDLADPIQTYVVGVDTSFSNLASAAPKAQYCAVMRDFLMVGNTNDSIDGARPERVWWPAIGDPTNWPTPGTNAAVEVQSDFQDLQQTDLGQITGLVGGFLNSADGLVFCERGIYRVVYVGSPAIFDFSVAQGAAGTQSPLSLVQRYIRGGSTVLSVTYYLGEDGFYAHDGATPIPIGAQKIDKWFFNDLNVDYLGWVTGVADPINKLIFWFYMGADSGATGLFNRAIVFNWDLGRWAYCDLTATPLEMAARAMTIGYSLDQLDIFGTLDTLPASLDSRLWTGGKIALGAFDQTHKLNFFTGSNMAPIVETSETQPTPARRSIITMARPITDGTPASVAVGHRDKLSDSVTYDVAVPVNILGDCPQFSSGRYARFQVTLPAATSYSHIQGVDTGIDGILPEGRQ